MRSHIFALENRSYTEKLVYPKNINIFNGSMEVYTILFNFETLCGFYHGYFF